jgi:hypothetical protein
MTKKGAPAAHELTATPYVRCNDAPCFVSIRWHSNDVDKQQLHLQPRSCKSTDTGVASKARSDVAAHTALGKRMIRAANSFAADERR